MQTWLLSQLVEVKGLKGRLTKRKKQVTRGHNIVAVGGTGAYNPYLYPPPTHALSHTQTIIIEAS